MVDILDEAISDIKQERANNIFMKYGKMALMFLIVFVISSLAYLWWDNYQKNKIYEQGGQFMQAMLKLGIGEIEEGSNILKQMVDKETAYAALSGLHYAAGQNHQGKPENAVQTYDEIIANGEGKSIFTDYAKLLKINTQIINKFIDNAQAIILLKSYVQEDSAFKATAQEILAALLITEKDYSQAKDLLHSIMENPEAAISSKLKAKQLLLLIQN